MPVSVLKDVTVVEKQSISLDLKAPEGKKICLDLARKADVCARCPPCQTTRGHFLSRARARIEPQ